MNKLSVRILFVLTLLGMGYVSYNLREANSYSEEYELVRKLLIDEETDQIQKSELIDKLESELKESERLNHLIYILNGSILIFSLGLFLATPKRKN